MKPIKLMILNFVYLHPLDNPLKYKVWYAIPRKSVTQQARCHVGKHPQPALLAKMQNEKQETPIRTNARHAAKKKKIKFWYQDITGARSSVCRVETSSFKFSQAQLNSSILHIDDAGNDPLF